jgi:uncharacterized cupredoxin-like copper-binding protein
MRSSRRSSLRSRHSRALFAVVGALLLVLVAAASACSSSPVEGGDAAHTTEDGQLILERVGLFDANADRTIELALEDIEFSEDDLNVEAGAVVELHLENTGSLDHDYTMNRLGTPSAVEAGAGGEQRHGGSFAVHVALDRGDEATVRLRLEEAGEYVFYCTVPGHRSAGMEGTITVR